MKDDGYLQRLDVEINGVLNDIAKLEALNPYSVLFKNGKPKNLNKLFYLEYYEYPRIVANTTNAIIYLKDWLSVLCEYKYKHIEYLRKQEMNIQNKYNRGVGR